LTNSIHYVIVKSRGCKFNTIVSAIKKLIIGAIGIMISLSLVSFLKAGAIKSNLYKNICQIRGSLNSKKSMVIAELTYRMNVDNVERLDGRYPQDG